jgi:Domain of unknown function (DUF4185)
MHGIRTVRLIVATSVVAVALLASLWLALLQGPLEFRTVKVCQLTGQEDRERPGNPTGIKLSSAVPDAGITGSDLGFPFEYNGELRLLFGDTREVHPDLCEPGVCGTPKDQIPKFGVPPGTPRVESQAEWDRLTRHRDGADSIAWAPLNRDPEKCLPLTFEIDEPDDIGPRFHAVTLDGKHLGRLETPVSGFSDGQLLYAFFTVRDRPSGCLQQDIPDGCALGDKEPGGQSKLAMSTDGGRTFKSICVGAQDCAVSKKKFQWPVPLVARARDIPGLPPDLTQHVVLIWGSGRLEGEEFRHSYPYLAVAPLPLVGIIGSWRYFAGLGADGKPKWSEHETEARRLPPFGSQPPLGLDPVRLPPYHKCLGEFSVGYIQEWQKWVMLYACGGGDGYNRENRRGVHLRTADAPWGPWSPPQLVFNPEDGYCHFMHHQSSCAPNPGDKGFVDLMAGKLQYGGEYAPFLMPGYTKVDGDTTSLYFVMSTWNPYQVVLMRTRVRPPRWWDLPARWDYVRRGFN